MQVRKWLDKDDADRQLERDICEIHEGSNREVHWCTAERIEPAWTVLDDVISPQHVSLMKQVSYSSSSRKFLDTESCLSEYNQTECSLSSHVTPPPSPRSYLRILHDSSLSTLALTLACMALTRRLLTGPPPPLPLPLLLLQLDP